MRQTSIKPKFVDLIPERLEEGVLYICDRYQIVAHKCCCGCGTEVVTPLSPVEWAVKKSGDSVSLSPSIGNWSFKCKSHYWIIKNGVVWAGQLSQSQIDHVQARDKNDKEAYIKEKNLQKSQQAKPTSLIISLWKAFIRWWQSLFQE